MRTPSTMLVLTILLSLLLPGMGTRVQPRHLPRSGQHLKRQHTLPMTRLRRWREEPSENAPLRRGLFAVFAAEDDDDDDGERTRSSGKETQDALAVACTESPHHAAFRVGRSRPLPTATPRYQALCHLLI